MKKRMSHPAVQEIYQMLDFCLRKTALGLLPFMDRNIPLPSSKEIADAIRTSRISAETGTRVVQGLPLPEQQQVIELSERYMGIIDQYGGERIRDAFEEHRPTNLNGHSLLWDWSRKGQKGVKTMAEIAERHGYNNSGVLYKIRRTCLEEISFNIFMRFMSK